MNPYPDDEPPAADWDDDEPSPRRRRHPVLKLVALVLVIGMLLAFPLGYVLEAESRNQNVEATVALVEVTIAVVLVVLVRASRRI